MVIQRQKVLLENSYILVVYTSCIERLSNLVLNRRSRDRLYIISEILEIAIDGALKSEIMYKANLSYANLNAYLSFLLSIVLLKREKKKIYKTTPKGLEYLLSYRGIQQLVISGKHSQKPEITELKLEKKKPLEAEKSERVQTVAVDRLTLMRELKSDIRKLKGRIAILETKILRRGTCPTCGREILPDFRLCPYCGRTLLTSKEPELAKVGKK